MVIFRPYFGFFSGNSLGYSHQKESRLIEKYLITNSKNKIQTRSDSRAENRHLLILFVALFLFISSLTELRSFFNLSV